MSADMEREPCARCTMKHLAQANARLWLCQAKILMKESKLGYPHHVWYAMGHMAEAHDEIVDIMPEEATAIREERIKMQDALMRDEIYVPDFHRLFDMVAEGAMLEEVQGG